MLYKDKLKSLRERNNIKQKDLLKIVNISDTQYSAYEKENEIMPIKHLNSLCNYFNISFDYIFNFTNIEKYDYLISNINQIEVGERLRDFRKENKLTQVKLANVLNTTQSTIAAYESGKCLITTPFLYTICSKYHISADYLLGKTDNPKYLK